MLDINKVIVLENGEKYLILDRITDDSTVYYYIAKINITETDIENNFKLITIDNDNVIEEVTGEEKLKKILPLFSR